MHFVITPYAVMNAIGAMISLIVAFFAMRIGSPGSKYLSWMLLASAIWTGGAAMEMATVSIPGQILWAKFQYFGVVSCPVLYLAFTVNYVNPGMVIPGRRLGVLFIIPVITFILA